MATTPGAEILIVLRALRAAREKLGYSQKYIAGLVRVSERTLHSWESGITEPSLSRLCRWAHFLGLKLTLGGAT